METTDKNRVIVELHDTPFTEHQEERIGKVVTTASITEDDLVADIVAHRTDISAVTLKAAFELLTEAAMHRVANGASVRFGLAHFQLGVNGVFVGKGAQWDSGSHRLNVQVTPTADLRNVVRKVDVQVRGVASSGIGINTVTDVVTGTVNDRITPGNGIHITGSRLKIAGEHPDVGVTLIHQATHETFAIDRKSIVVNYPTRMTLILPASMPTGEYQLTICTQYSMSGRLNASPGYYTFPFELKVL